MQRCMSGWVGEQVGGYLGRWVDGKMDGAHFALGFLSILN